MSDEPTIITVTVEIDGTEYVRQVQGTHWARGSSADNHSVYVYNEGETVLEVSADHFVEAFHEDAVETIATIDS